LNIQGDELSTTTDALGNYSFAHLVPGIYNIAEVPQTGWTPTEVHPAVTLATGLNSNVNLGNSPPVIPGDYSDNGNVSSIGYVTWRKQSGSSGPNLSADGNHDNNVDSKDYAVWRENFGNSYDDYGNNA